MAVAAAETAHLPLAVWLHRVIRAQCAAEGILPPPSGRAVSPAAQRALELVAENLRYAHFPPLDEARAYWRLMTEFGLSLDTIAVTIDRQPEQVVRTLRLLGLPEKVRQLIERRALSPQHAYALLEAENPEALADATRALGSAAEASRAPPRARAPAGKAG
jgi:ParB-like chromosome segregation protein Spo0J